MLTRVFDAEVLQADHLADTLVQLEQHAVDLVLVNRKLDIDYSDGLEIIKAIKSHQQFGKIPVMLVSNLEDYQAEAVAAGAEYGFGKLALASPETHTRIRKVFDIPVE